MALKIFLLSAALVLAGSSANAFNIGGMLSGGANIVGKIGEGLGDTKCTSNVFSKVSVDSERVRYCFINRAPSQNPNAAKSFFSTNCRAGSQNLRGPNANVFDEACQNVAGALGLNYRPAPQQQRRPAPQQQMRSAPQQQRGPAPQQQRGPQRQQTIPQQHFQSNQGGYGHDDYDYDNNGYGHDNYGHDAYDNNGYGHEDYGHEDYGQGGYGHEDYGQGDYGHDGYGNNGYGQGDYNQDDDQYEMGAS